MTVKELLKYEIVTRSSFDYIFTKYKNYSFWLYYNKDFHYIRMEGEHSFAINNSSGTTIVDKGHLEDKL